MVDLSKREKDCLMIYMIYGAATSGDIASELDISESAASGLVQRCEDKGVIRKVNGGPTRALTLKGLRHAQIDAQQWLPKIIRNGVNR